MTHHEAPFSVRDVKYRLDWNFEHYQWRVYVDGKPCEWRMTEYEDCAECRLARLLWEEQAYREGVTQAPKISVSDIDDPSVTPGSIT